MAWYTRHHGLLGTPHDRRFTRHLVHTLGANAVFVAFATAARQVQARGQDEALEAWRSAAACTRGSFRPDGYGCYRRSVSRYGFFLEFDRGTEKPREYAAKLATYYRYRNSGAAARDYATFPTLLVVTTSRLAEERFASQACLAAQRSCATPLSVFLTTTERIHTHAHGVLGASWCVPSRAPAHDQLRISWLPPQASRAAHTVELSAGRMRSEALLRPRRHNQASPPASVGPASCMVAAKLLQEDR
jgi:hypothetical protein